ncbi:J domain-containing protein [Paenibacillus filicis]|uniref:J domain-containing protein n=1 Tax=Paenibacillus filicis TaxID=669464 RepID=A0ABU9DEF3_9BACL
MKKSGRKRPDEALDFIVVEDEYLIGIVKALTNLTPGWSVKLKQGGLKLHMAVQLGSRLTSEQQLQYMEFHSDHPIPEIYMGKILYAFARDMPEWAIHSVLRIYRLAAATKASMIRFNDLMDEYEKLVQQFEYAYLEAELPTDDEGLEQALVDVEARLRHLYNQVPAREQMDYNQSYSDSSSASGPKNPSRSGSSFQTLIGAEEHASPDEIRRQSRRLLKKLHPDRGGSAYLFQWVKQAYDAYLHK